MKHAIDRFMDKCIPEPNSGCWLWEGADNGRYGVFRGPNRIILAHRFSWEEFNQEDAGLMNILHLCNNKMCVNPDHLRLGTQSENIRQWHAQRKR